MRGPPRRRLAIGACETRAATSGPATPPMAFPICVSRPASLYRGPNPPENRPMGSGSSIEQSAKMQTPAVIHWRMRHFVVLDRVDPQGVRIIEKNSQSLARLINDLLDMSSILSGKMRIERASVEIPSVVREAAETAKMSGEVEAALVMFRARFDVAVDAVPAVAKALDRVADEREVAAEVLPGEPGVGLEPRHVAPQRAEDIPCRVPVLDHVAPLRTTDRCDPVGAVAHGHEGSYVRPRKSGVRIGA